MNTYRNNHYVPEWYQNNFLRNPKANNFFYLDLSPDFLSLPNHKIIRCKDTKIAGPGKCFTQKDLYTTFFGDKYSTEIEKIFFGEVDTKASFAIQHFLNFDYENYEQGAFQDFMTHLSLQRMRTPKGLSNLKKILNIKSENDVLFEIQRIKNIFCSAWSDCVWQLAYARSSNTKFILSDSPVTLYNRNASPKSYTCQTNGDPAVAQLGTHVIYALSDEVVLILTHASYLRDPWLSPQKTIPNPKPFRNTIFPLLDIQTRELNETEVREINFIIKQRAFRYVAASNEEWLYPENSLSSCSWHNLGSGDLLMPDPRSYKFTTKTILGYSSGASQIFDANHFQPHQKGFRKEPDSDAFARFSAFQAFFAERHGPQRRGRAHTFGRMDNYRDSDDYFNSITGKIPDYIAKWGKPPFYT